MQQCIPPSRAHEWDAYKHGWERLLKLVEDGDFVLVLNRGYPPLIPAFRNVNGQWEVADQVAGLLFNKDVGRAVR